MQNRSDPDRQPLAHSQEIGPERSAPLEKPKDKCGVFAVHRYSGAVNASIITYLGLLALQHRGQESAGIAYNSDTGLQVIKGMGLVDQVFTRKMLTVIKADSILGHVRYSTTGTSALANAQPLVARSVETTGIALAHNGNLSNNPALKEELLGQGHIFHASTDTETMLAYLYRHRAKGLVQAAVDTMNIIDGAYASVFTDGTQTVAFRDPRGFRPLVIGRLGSGYVFSSETCALDTCGAEFIREIEPGEVVSVKDGSMESVQALKSSCRAFCIFEYVYFARPDSVFNDRCVHEVRRKIGSLLARRFSASIDLVIPSPDSGISAAIGLAEALKLPLEWAVHRNPYLGRTFIEPTQDARALAVKLKFNPILQLIKGKKVAVVDDSLVRGTTAKVLTALLRAAGATEIHLCIASPPYKYPCFYGIDIPVSSDLAATGADSCQLAKSIGADSITFAKPEDLYEAAGGGPECYCTACFSGCYPTGEPAQP